MSDKPDEKDLPTSPAVGKHLFDARKILITGGIDDDVARDVVSRLLAMAHVSDDPITVFISSPGGHVESGDMIHDAIKFIKPEVRVVGTGWVASAGALIYAAAKKENRYSLPNTRFLLHQPSGGMRGTAEDISIQAKEIIRMRGRLNQIFADATGQPIARIEQDTDRDFWMSVEEAVEYGLATHVIQNESEIK
ncbi:MAG: ATP-dependent Clp protease proteolytic subunit [Pseudomonadota bacterium]